MAFSVEPQLAFSAGLLKAISAGRYHNKGYEIGRRQERDFREYLKERGNNSDDGEE